MGTDDRPIREYIKPQRQALAARGKSRFWPCFHFAWR
jgi:hypothetical protein